MFRIVFLTNNCSFQGGPAEVSLRGTLKAKFSPASNKLISVNIVFDSGILSSQIGRVQKTSGSAPIDSAAVAAQAAASEADAILDSLQMPHIEPASVPTNVTVGNVTDPASITDIEKEVSSDESAQSSEESSKSVPAARRAPRAG